MFPYSQMTTVSRTYRCIKCNCITVLVAARPGHPFTRQLREPPLSGKAMRYVCGYSPMAEFSRFISPLLLAHAVSVGGPLYRHFLPVGRPRLDPCRLEWALDHAKCLPDIIPHDQPINQSDHGTKFTLEPSWVRRCNHSIVSVEEGILTYQYIILV